MAKYRSTYRCTDCNYNYERITHYLPKKEPACPVCKKTKRVKSKGVVSENMPGFDNGGIQSMIDSNKAPSVGGSIAVRAVDETAKMVMEDYGMTDLNMGSTTRAGDTCAPKLAPHLQAQADSMFGNTKSTSMKVKDINTGRYVNLDAGKSRAMSTFQQKLTKKINSGALRSPEVNKVLTNPGKLNYQPINKT